MKARGELQMGLLPLPLAPRRTTGGGGFCGKDGQRANHAVATPAPNRFLGPKEN